MSDMTAKKHQRPLWYNLSPLNLPLPGLVSIFHRISGLLLFLVIPFLIYALQLSLASQAGDRKSTRLNSSHSQQSRMPSSA